MVFLSSTFLITKSIFAPQLVAVNTLKAITFIVLVLMIQLGLLLTPWKIKLRGTEMDHPETVTPKWTVTNKYVDKTL